ncbi:vWA domain-containing protein [Pseudoalteromonas luteoviolacea]|uniref:VWFA domain-containing protein n=1 Tax=Pseudoalteromonas luteoviolacea S4060-1 TaxID=1365257 RepID=A0A162BFZ1_9GAMM|nr:VWA domain-containing protein [Pseudoalteromonas luteoviolacea]KZN61477.1 hypothetical protein N478_05240 [Pseudoalteromonas luteoviolacea S4060-1]
MTEFQFIRPDLLWLLVPWAIITIIQWYKRASTQETPIIAPHLANIVLAKSDEQKVSQSSWLTGLILFLSILAIAGPSIEKQSVPVFTAKQARVIVMDMSYSMYSTDIAPNRLTQARFKTLDMLQLFKEGDTALVAYAQDAFIVSPLTSDIKTLENLVPSISPQIMPGKGSNVLAGIDQAKTLLEQANYTQGEIILVTDEVETEEVTDIQSMLSNSGYSLHVYGVGTVQGAPISVPEGGFLKDRYGQIVVPKLYVDRLKSLAQRLGGNYASYTPDSSDIQSFANIQRSDIERPDQPNETLWRIDAGKYLLFVILPLALITFRKSALALCLTLFVYLPSTPSYAAEWQSWFKNTDQNALSAYQDKDYESAGSAHDLTLKGAALYQQGEFEQAANVLAQSDSSIGQYNLGNALAQLGKLDEAIDAYNRALDINPEFEQAKQNKALVEQLKEQQQNSDQNDQQQNQQSSEQQDGEQQQSQEPSQSNSDQQGEQDAQQQDSQGNESDEQQSEQSQNANGEEQQESENQNQPELANKESEQDSDGQPQPQQVDRTQPNEAQGEQSKQQVQGQMRELTPEEKEKAQQLDQLLRRVPDDPAILLKNKMLLESRQRQQQRQPVGAEKSW